MLNLTVELTRSDNNFMSSTFVLLYNNLHVVVDVVQSSRSSRRHQAVGTLQYQQVNKVDT